MCLDQEVPYLFCFFIEATKEKSSFFRLFALCLHHLTVGIIHVGGHRFSKRLQFSKSWRKLNANANSCRVPNNDNLEMSVLTKIVIVMKYRYSDISLAPILSKSLFISLVVTNRKRMRHHIITMEHRWYDIWLCAMENF